MRLGGMVFESKENPYKWAKKAVDMGYKTVNFPVDHTANIKIIDEFVEAIQENSLTIAEVGIWKNTSSLDKSVRNAAIEEAIKKLELADYVKARCAVNISGTCTDFWYGPDIYNYSEEAFEKIIKNTQKIIDTAKPKHAFFALEPMQWLYPDTADSYLKLVKEIDRTQFAVHIDMVNTINSAEKYFNNKAIVKEWFDKLSPYIKSCHIKDVILEERLGFHLAECPPGTGKMDYEYMLTRINQLDKDTSIILEHMAEEKDVVSSIKFVKDTCKKLNIDL